MGGAPRGGDGGVLDVCASVLCPLLAQLGERRVAVGAVPLVDMLSQVARDGEVLTAHRLAVGSSKCRLKAASDKTAVVITEALLLRRLASA